MKKRKANDDVIADWYAYALEKLILSERKIEKRDQTKPAVLDTAVDLFDLSDTNNFIPHAAGTPLDRKRRRTKPVGRQEA